MLTLKPTTKFRKDYKRMKKQGKDMSLLQSVIDDLLLEKNLIRNITIICCPEIMKAFGNAIFSRTGF